MRPWEAWVNHAALAVAALTGVVYGVLKYFVPPQNPDSRLAVPWQPSVLAVHVLFAPILVFGLGLLFRRHALLQLGSGERSGRRSGVALLSMAAPLVLSGYAVQAFSASDASRPLGWLHAGAGAAFALAWLGHLLKRRPGPKEREEPLSSLP